MTHECTLITSHRKTEKEIQCEGDMITNILGVTSLGVMEILVTFSDFLAGHWMRKANTRVRKERERESRLESLLKCEALAQTQLVFTSRHISYRSMLCLLFYRSPHPYYRYPKHSKSHHSTPPSTTSIFCSWRRSFLIPLSPHTQDNEIISYKDLAIKSSWF